VHLITLSHCDVSCKGDTSSQWERATLPLSPHPHPLIIIIRPEVASVFFGSRLLALNKKSGGIRPIVVDFTLRRLASKYANSFRIGRLKSYFEPHQLGVGSSGGCEAAIHAARRYLESLPPDHTVVKLDFANAFNTLHRYDMLQAIHF